MSLFLLGTSSRSPGLDYRVQGNRITLTDSRTVLRATLPFRVRGRHVRLELISEAGGYWSIHQALLGRKFSRPGMGG